MPWKRRTIPLTSSPAAEDLAEAAKRLAATAKRLERETPPDETLREQAALRAVGMADELDDLAGGRLVFGSTETWRSVYEAVLSGCSQRRYLSVALVQSEDYWRDRPGQSSLQFNYRLVEHGFQVVRGLLIDDFFWPPAARLPDRRLLHWAQSQQSQGVQVTLARVSEVEEGLRLDFGVYGERAVGYQVVDEQGRTERYEMRFDESSRRVAEDRWRRLELFLTPLEALLGDGTV